MDNNPKYRKRQVIVDPTGLKEMEVNEDGSINTQQVPGTVADVTIVDPDTGTAAKVNDDGQLHIVAEGHLCTDNSTTTPLSAGAIYTGNAVEILAYNAISVFCTSDVASEIAGLKAQYSKDGVTNWRTAESYTVLAGAEKWFSPPSFGVYFRIVYTNGAADQTSFELTTVLRKVPFKWSSHNIEDPITDQDDATLTKAVITGKKTNGDYGNVNLTNGGNMKMSLEELETDVSEDANTSLRVAPILVDEFGETGRMLSDNIFLGAPVVIESEHHEIHCGDSYEATHNVSLGNGASLDFLLTVPNETGTGQTLKLYHIVGVIESESELEVQIWESPTVTAAGTAITSVNRHFNDPKTDFLGITQGGTVSADGTSKWGPWRVGSGRSIAGSSSRTREFILKNNTVYLMRITNQTNATNNVNVEFDYYVHPGV